MPSLRLFLLLWIFADALTGLHAIGTPSETVTFKRITQLSEIDDYACYAIVFPDNGGNVVAVSTTLFRDTKLKAYESGSVAGEDMSMPLETVGWAIKRLDNGHVELHATSGGGVLRRTAPGDVGLEFADKPDAQCEWEIVSVAEGRFNFCEPHTGRGISRSVVSNTQVFDNYKYPPKNGFYIYRYSTRYADRPGHAELPANGRRVTLCNEGYVPTDAGVGTAADATEYMLCDGQLAQMPGMQIWTCERTGGNDFTLRNGTDYLGYDLKPQAARAVWRITDGHICTTEDTPRYLCYDTAQHSWQVVTEKEATITAQTAYVADAPQKNTIEGICRLSGGWSAEALAEIPLADVYCLDLTEAILPRTPHRFNHPAATANMPVFVSADMVHCIPASWPFVISCGTERKLLRPFTLKDREPFMTDRSFKVDAGLLSYTRSGMQSGKWQTLCLPFAANAEGFHAAALSAVEDGKLTFTEVTTMEAGRAYIFSGPDSQRGQNILQIHSIACTVAPNIVQTGTLQGVFMPFTVAHTTDGIYMLSPQADEFRHAAAGSSLAPFRAFLHPAGGASRAVFNWSIADSF